MDCHQQATHTFQTAEDAIDEAMAVGSPNPALPFVHKKGLELIQADYKSQDEAAQKITAGLDSFYQHAVSGDLERAAWCGGCGGADPGGDLQAECVSGDEGDVGDVSQRHGA